MRSFERSTVPQTPHLGWEPWSVSEESFPADGGSSEKLEFCIHYAILAPSTHNTQPWRFHMIGNQLELHANVGRQLAVVDPAGRELIMSCGAALAHLRIALNHFGFSGEIELFPDPGTPDLLARIGLGVEFDPDLENTLLFDAIPRRRTNRMPFRDEPVTPELLALFQKQATDEGAWLEFLTEERSRAAVAELVAEADRIQWSDKALREELAAWVRPNRSVRRDGMPGYVYGLGDVLSQVAAQVIRRFDRGAVQAKNDSELALYSPVLAVLGTEGDSLADWLRAGQALAKILLRARAEDVWASFLNQPIQIPALLPYMVQATGRSGFPQLMFRMGFGQDVPPTPRFSLPEVVVRPPQVFKLGKDHGIKTSLSPKRQQLLPEEDHPFH